MRSRIAVTILLLCAIPLAAQQTKKKGGKKRSGEGPQPRVVAPSAQSPWTTPPSDAVILFDGKDMSAWTNLEGGAAGCRVDGTEMICETGAGDIVSKEQFTDAQIHLEFLIPDMPAQTGQHKGNSGAYLQSCYETQILDGYRNPTYADGTIGALYGFRPPLVNAARKPAEWQSYDIIFHGAQCDGQGNVTKPGSATILLNGVLVQENTVLDKKGPGCRKENQCGAGPLRLQDHSGFPNAPHTVMKFRNIWLRKLE